MEIDKTMAAAVDSSRSQKHSNSNSSLNKVIQITNIAPQATKDQMQNLFGCIGKIDEIRLYPTVRDVTLPVHSRVCYVKFFDTSCVSVAQHLTNTVYIDRALIVCPVNSGQIPDEFKALEMTNNGSSVPGMHNNTQLPPEVENYTDGEVCLLRRSLSSFMICNNLLSYAFTVFTHSGPQIRRI